MEARTEPRVSVIVLNWNNYDETRKCLESLQQAGYPSLKVIVVDNGSADGSGKRLESEFPGFKFVFNTKNLGFARGCNTGIREALRDEECKYVLLLNNDAVVTPNFLDKAVETAEMGRSIGLVGGKILQSPESRKIWYAGGYIDRWRGQAKTRWGETDHGQYDKTEEVGFVTGCLMLIKREVLENVGLLPEEYFFGVEEWDYSLTVRRAGYRLYYVPEFLVYHKGDGSHWNYDPKFVYNSYRNKLIFQEKFLPKGLFPIWRISFVIYGKYVARRARARLIKKHNFGKDKIVSLKDLDFALIKAVEDHGKNVLSEETIASFDEALGKESVT